MTEIPKMSLSAHRRNQDSRSRARDELEMLMRSHWNELSGVQPQDRTGVGRQNLIRLLGAYAGKIFEVGAAELVHWKLDPSDVAKRLDEIVSEVQVHMIPPQFDFHTGFCLSELEYDEAYRSHIKEVLGECVSSWKERRVAEAAEASHLSPHGIIERYCKQEKCTIQQLAVKATVDASVIYAIKAGKKKYGAEALARIAGIVGCDSSDLAPKA